MSAEVSDSFFFKSLGNTMKMPNSFDLDQTGLNVRPDLDQNCLHRLSGGNKSQH